MKLFLQENKVWYQFETCQPNKTISHHCHVRDSRKAGNWTQRQIWCNSRNLIWKTMPDLRVRWDIRWGWKPELSKQAKGKQTRTTNQPGTLKSKSQVKEATRKRFKNREEDKENTIMNHSKKTRTGSMMINWQRKRGKSRLSSENSDQLV